MRLFVLVAQLDEYVFDDLGFFGSEERVLLGVAHSSDFDFNYWTER